MTTTIAQFCSYEVNVSRTDVDPRAECRVFHFFQARIAHHGL